MNYSDKNDMVRVDFFKESGKWYCTEAVEFERFVGNINDVFLKSLKKHTKDGRLKGMWAVCLHPWHEHSHPLMVKVPD